tara:strand:- start:174 stop:554 length:381 start_codon:yes stop_codon:yes gene_type:complete
MTQTTQTATHVKNKLCQLFLKSQKFWTDLYPFLPERAKRDLSVFIKAVAGNAIKHNYALKCAVVQEVTAWFEKDKRRMKDYETFDKNNIMELARTTCAAWPLHHPVTKGTICNPAYSRMSALATAL